MWCGLLREDLGELGFREDFTVCTHCEVFIKPESTTQSTVGPQHMREKIRREAHGIEKAGESLERRIQGPERGLRNLGVHPGNPSNSPYLPKRGTRRS